MFTRFYGYIVSRSIRNKLGFNAEIICYTVEIILE